MKIGEISKRFSEAELCDIYCNLENFEWDKRLGRKPYYFDSLPTIRKGLGAKFLKKISKEDELKPYKEQIESMTTEYMRKKYFYVSLCKKMDEAEFDELWESLEC